MVVFYDERLTSPIWSRVEAYGRGGYHIIYTVEWKEMNEIYKRENMPRWALLYKLRYSDNKLHR